MAKHAGASGIGADARITQDATGYDAGASGSAAGRKGFTNQWVFAKVMHDNRDICRDVASAVLGRRIDRVEMLDVESTEPTIAVRGVRFDVYFQGDGEAVAMEMQASDEKNLALRSRYYHAHLDRRLLPKGKKLATLARAYVVFICTFDPVGRGAAVYEVKRWCRALAGGEPNAGNAGDGQDGASNNIGRSENADGSWDGAAGGKPFPHEDGTRTYYLNAQGDLSGLGGDLAGLLQYVRTGADDGSCGLVGRIEGAIERAYEDESWVSDMRLYEYDQIEDRERACAKARAEALAEGRVEGEKRQAALLARMSELGRDAGEFLDAVANGTLGDLYRKYGIE